MIFLDQFLVFGAFLSLGFLLAKNYHDSFMEEKNLLDPKNREDILKTCFYDYSEKERVVARLRTIEKKISASLYSKNISLFDYIKLEAKAEAAHELRIAIQSDEYGHKLVKMTKEDRKFDNWDSF